MLNNAELLKNAGYINGEWTGSESDKRFEVTNAFSKEVICTLPDMGAKELMTPLKPPTIPGQIGEVELPKKEQ